MRYRIIFFSLGLAVCLATHFFVASSPVIAQALEAQLKQYGAEQLVAEANQFGDPERGAIVFYQAYLSCTRCHTPDENQQQLGPALTALGEDATDVHMVESILEPSKVIRRGYETANIFTHDGDVLQGLVAEETDTHVTLRDANRDFKAVTIAKESIEERATSDVSMMPAGLTNALTSRQQFLDLLRYVLEIRDGGPARARQLEPPPSTYAARPLPEYESRVDHAGLIRAWDDAAYERGEAIYNRLCINCHGTIEQPGSLPTSLRFAEGRFKNGSDPFTMYQTLTRGFGMMVAQTWMVPSQKYDVIHYIRSAYLQPHNPTQWAEVTDEYLASLPAGDTFGPEPTNILEWEQMDYGPNLVMTLEFGDDHSNIAQKANAIRLDAGPGGVSQGKYWMAYDYDTLRVAGAWSGDQFCDWRGINFDGSHGRHPRATGAIHVVNPTGPGWGRPSDGSFFDDSRVVGRDGRQYGPLPRAWAQYRGMYYHGPNTIIRYTVGKTDVLEMPSVLTHETAPVFARTFNIGPRAEAMVLQVAHQRQATLYRDAQEEYVVFGEHAIRGAAPGQDPPVNEAAGSFSGSHYWELRDTDGLPINDADFLITARIKTTEDGTIVAQTSNTPQWQPNGLTWFVRGGRLAVDIGWVGAVRGEIEVSDGQWHDVAFAYRHRDGAITFAVDGARDRVRGKLKREASLESPVVRIGFTSSDFPKPTAFLGQIADVKWYRGTVPDPTNQVAHWRFDRPAGQTLDDLSDRQNQLQRVATQVEAQGELVEQSLVAGILGDGSGTEWISEDDALRLRIPAGDRPLRFTIWFGNVAPGSRPQQLADEVVIDQPDRDLVELTRGGPARWPQALTTQATLGDSTGPFAVDVLQRPAENPWFCRLRLTGLDFLPDGDRMVVSAWDGNVWLVSGLNQLVQGEGRQDGDTMGITWRRIASGLFQPLGIKYHDGKVYVTCRDELCVLHDLNGDEEIDWYECFNNDHQVTEHFHEFAMGLQVDEAGNFYYAKSARHALEAVVPHHGTLLRVSADGQRTDIVANGFRAANGVCINPDGTFVVTDQEGHWNPKNRINYVRPGGFYGNMFGYHDVVDDSDDAMEQPLVWITNEFDRSPGELLWVESDAWKPLQGRLLNLSYGYGMIYVVPHEVLNGQPQGGMCAFPIGRLPTGVMRGRFSPYDGQLYTCGMFAWAGNQTQPGGLYRIRYTDKPVHLPVELHATRQGMRVTFSGELEPDSATDVGNYQVKVWSLKRTANYGSQHYDEHALAVSQVELSGDRRSVHLTIPDIGPTWCMEIRYRVQASDGTTVDGRIHNTIHALE